MNDGKRLDTSVSLPESTNGILAIGRWDKGRFLKQ